MHTTGAITSYIDVAQLTLYAFWIFFAGLVIYLILESKREGFPLVTNRPGERLVGILPMPSKKTFLLPGGKTKSVPQFEVPEVLNLRQTSNFEGAPYEPLGNPMLDAVGPASYTLREPLPELTPHGAHRTIPMRIDPEYSVAAEDPDPRGLDVICTDGMVGGVVADIWVDRIECQVRFIEVALPDPLARHVIIPVELTRISLNARGGVMKVACVTAAQFALAPVTESPDFITAREEDRISAYFGSGHLYATELRFGPLL